MLVRLTNGTRPPYCHSPQENETGSGERYGGSRREHEPVPAGTMIGSMPKFQMTPEPIDPGRWKLSSLSASGSAGP